MTEPVQDLDGTAFPTTLRDAFGQNVQYPGVTKLQWAAVQLACAMISTGKPPEDLEVAAVRAATKILKKAAP